MRWLIFFAVLVVAQWEPTGRLILLLLASSLLHLCGRRLAL